MRAKTGHAQKRRFGLEKYWRSAAVLRGRELTEMDCGGFSRRRRLGDDALRVSEFAD